MSKLESDVEIVAVKLRKLAAFHQSGMSLAEVKLQVDTTIQQMKETLGKDKTQQAIKWTELLNSLEKFNRNTAHPMWMAVIKHAKFRIKSRIQTAVYCRKHFKGNAY